MMKIEFEFDHPEFLSYSGLDWLEWRREEIVQTVGPDIHSVIHSIFKNTVNFVAFGAEQSANGCIWLAHSTSTVFY